jgi:hydroxylamine dehydrogenase
MGLRTLFLIKAAACITVLIFAPVVIFANDEAMASQCVDCHNKVTPNIVSDWKLSKHCQVEVTCTSCHGDQHTSTSDVAKVKLPTPDTCATCHEAQVEQYKKGKHSMAWAAMKAMPSIGSRWR